MQHGEYSRYLERGERRGIGIVMRGANRLGEEEEPGIIRVILTDSSSFI
jgi:hypothetical protein